MVLLNQGLLYTAEMLIGQQVELRKPSQCVVRHDCDSTSPADVTLDAQRHAGVTLGAGNERRISPR